MENPAQASEAKKRAPTIEGVIELFLHETRPSLMYLQVAERLGTEANETRSLMIEMERKGILCKLTAPPTHYILAPSELWKDDSLKKKYASQVAPEEN